MDDRGEDMKLNKASILGQRLYAASLLDRQSVHDFSILAISPFPTHQTHPSSITSLNPLDTTTPPYLR